MLQAFEEGYRFFADNAGAYFASEDGALFGADRASYVHSVQDAIEDLEWDINHFQGYNTPVSALKGNVAEFWAADTFNVNAAMERSANRAEVLESHGFASVDVATNFGQDYGLKYYGSGEESAKAQAVSVFQKFSEYKSKGGKDDLAKFLADRNYADESVLNDPIYTGQLRLIPRDQMDAATAFLERQIAKQSAIRPDQVKRYQDTLDMLRDRISDNEGVESIPLSEKEARELAEIAKAGEFRAEDYGITAPELLNLEMVMKESLKAGASAAIISLVLRTGPEIYKAIDELIRTGEIDEEQFKKVGFAAVTGSSEGFIRGSVASAITTVCKSGVLGESAKAINSSMVGVATVIVMNTLKNAYAVSKGEKSRTELTSELVRDMYVSAFSLAAGGITQGLITIPVLGYLVGSFIGSIVGSVTYEIGERTILSFCADTGITLFGLVKQDYELPDDVIQEIGLEHFDYESFKYDTFEPEGFIADTFEPESFEPQTLGITFLRRGVIGISKIGYVAA